MMKTIIKTIGWVLFFLIQANATFAQKNLKTHLGNHERRGDKLFHHFSYSQAIEAYENALENKESDALKLKIAECYRLLNNTEKTANWYEKVIENEKLIAPIHKFYYAEALSSNGQYEKAKYWYQQFCNEVKGDRRGMNKIQATGNIDKYYLDSAAYEIEIIGINCPLADFAPMYYNNGLVFVSERPTESLIKSVYNRREQAFLDLFYSEFDGDGNLTAPDKFHKKVNTKFHEGPVTFYNEEQNIIFTRNNYHKGKERKSKDGINKLKLFSAEKSADGGWINIMPLPFNSDEYSIGHPAISADGKRLYFSSDMPGGLGGTDLYVSYFENDTWTDPVNLGPDINTEGNEMFPYLSERNTLYFASNGWDGLGGLDIFKTDILEKGYTAPYNLGYPINSRQDDFALIVDSQGKIGYFSSRRLKGVGDDDIYRVLINKVTVEATVVNEENEPSQKPHEIVVVDRMTGQELPTHMEGDKLVFEGVPGRSYEVIAIVNDDKAVKRDVSIGTDENPSERKHVALPVEQVKMAPDIISDDPDYKVFAMNDMKKALPPDSEQDFQSDDYKLIEVGSGKEVPFQFKNRALSFDGKPDTKYMLKKLDNQKEEDLLLIQTRDHGSEKTMVSVPLSPEPGQPADQIAVVVIHHHDSVQYFSAVGQGALQAVQSLGPLNSQVTAGNEDEKKLFVIRNIYYDLDKYEIREDARAELDNIINLMNKYNDIHLVLTSHTDSRASNNYNIRLSKNRSASVGKYLAKNQIPESRVTTYHSGEKKLVNDCDDNKPCPEENHQLNRRTEFRLVIKQ